MCPSVYFWPYLSCQHLNSLLHSRWSCDPAQIPWRCAAVSLLHLKWGFSLNAELPACQTAIWQNELLQLRNAKSSTFTTRPHCESLLASSDNLVSQTWYLTSRGENFKICEIEEVTVIYTDRDWGRAVTEECEEILSSLSETCQNHRLCGKPSVICAIRVSEGSGLIHMMEFKDGRPNMDS